MDYRFYLNSTENEIVEYAKKSIAEVTDEDQLEDILLHLSLFTNGKFLKLLYPELIEKEIFYPREIYLHADEKIAEILIQLIEEGSEYVNNLLICLAWIGTQNVVDFFIKSSEEKPKWTEKLYVLPRIYANEAGWFIDGKNQKQSLIGDKISVFARYDFNEKSEIKSKTFVEEKSFCKFCKNNLTRVFENEISSKQIPFVTCLLCSCYAPFFMKIGKNGESYWHEANKKWEHLEKYGFEIEKIKENALVFSDENRKPEFTISQFVEISKSQIGGYPTWVQHAEYLNCPDCTRKMQYIGQIDMEDVEDYSEGIYYFHYCEKCKITGTNYQQT